MALAVKPRRKCAFHTQTNGRAPADCIACQRAREAADRISPLPPEQARRQKSVECRQPHPRPKQAQLPSPTRPIPTIRPTSFEEEVEAFRRRVDRALAPVPLPPIPAPAPSSPPPTAPSVSVQQEKPKRIPALQRAVSAGSSSRAYSFPVLNALQNGFDLRHPFTVEEEAALKVAWSAARNGGHITMQRYSEIQIEVLMPRRYPEA